MPSSVDAIERGAFSTMTRIFRDHQYASLTLQAATVLSFTAISTAAEYAVTRLDVPAGTLLYRPQALLSDGRPTGYVRLSQSAAPIDVPFVWDQSGHAQQLTVGAPYWQGVPLGAVGAAPVGTLKYLGSDPAGHPVIWEGQGVRELHTPTGYGTLFAGNGSNLVGEVYYPTASGLNSAASVWHDFECQVLDLPSTNSSAAWAVNKYGVYVGLWIDKSNPSEWIYGGFVGQNGTATKLDYAGFPQTRGFDINDDGWITGIWFGAGGVRRGYVARGDQIRDLGLFPGYAETWVGAINNDGTVVGSAANFGSLLRAMIWPNGSLSPVDLNLLADLPAGVTLRQAYDINNAGQILASGTGGFYVLTPVPEPSAAALVLSAATLICRKRNEAKRHGRDGLRNQFSA